MNIAYDAKRFFHNNAGLGNYSRDLVRIMATYFPENNYQLFTKKQSSRIQDFEDFKNIETILPSVPFPFWRQLQMGHQAAMAGAQVFHGLSGELPSFKKNENLKKIVTIHDLIFVRYPQYYNYLDRKIYLQKAKYACNTADVIVAVSEQTKQDCVAFLKIPEHKIKVVYQGCSDVFKHKADTDFLKNTSIKYNLPQEFILNVGTIEPRKNLLLIVQAIVGTNINLVVVGKPTHYLTEVQKCIADNNLKAQVHFLQNVNIQELAAIYQMAKVFVYPSLFEGFGIPIIEALYSNTPVITSYGSCFAEAAGEHSVYIAPTDAEELKTKILQILQNETLATNMKLKGWQHAQQFNDATIAEQWKLIYGF
jgi:glycosyltransferase involved in cell wall biosynthesis